MATVARADASRPSVHWAGRQTLPVFVFVWSATQAEARKPPAGLSVTNSHRGRLQMPLQNLAALRDLPPGSGAGRVRRRPGARPRPQPDAKPHAPAEARLRL